MVSHHNQLINSNYLQMFPEPLNGLSVWVIGYTIMEKTSDWTDTPKTVIVTLYKKRQLQKATAEEACCSQSSVSKYIHRKFSGTKKCGRKRCNGKRENCSLERIVKQIHPRI
ncbi:hypothetical protein CHARACLAT_032308 [Characodon lateralis]|uniref:Uncharacterized protein n=1 Tax=Characodon lateralis TaxID=208331 RepID=A0ABU7F914_9TELE|nr:hypothetical protein [Characodon lateralis]